LKTENDEISDEDLEKIWNQLEEADRELSGNKQNDKVFNVSKKIEAIKSEQISVTMLIEYLEIVKGEDEEVIQGLKKQGFQFTGDLEKDLKPY